MRNGYPQQYGGIIQYHYIYDFIHILQVHLLKLLRSLDLKVVIVVILCFNLNVYVMKTYKGKSYCIQLLHKDDQDKDPPVNNE